MENYKFPIIDFRATGKNIEKLRTERSMTVLELKKYLCLTSKNTIYKWQRGETIPSLDNLAALAKLFGVTMDEILVLEN